MFRPLHTDGTEAASVEHALVSDYEHAVWWTPGIEEAWKTVERMSAAMTDARRQIEELSRLNIGVKAAAASPASLPQRSGRGTERRKE
jgi:hypothetical protein